MFGDQLVLMELHWVITLKSSFCIPTLHLSKCDHFELFEKYNYFFRLVLQECNVGNINIYDGVCTTTDLKHLWGVSWIDKTSFEMKVNKFGQDSLLTFSCTAALYPNIEALPEGLSNCKTNSRKRRESHDDPKRANISISIPIRPSPGQLPVMSGAASAILQSLVFTFVFV